MNTVKCEVRWRGRRTVSGWRTGNSFPTADVLLAIALQYNLSIDRYHCDNTSRPGSRHQRLDHAAAVALQAFTSEPYAVQQIDTAAHASNEDILVG